MEVCTAGLRVVAEHAEGWLTMGMDYHSQVMRTPFLRIFCRAAEATRYAVHSLKTIVAYRAQGADGNAAVIAAQVCAERGLGAMPCLGGGADAAPACADDPAWKSTAHVGCESYAAGTPRSFHEFCAEDADHDGRTAAAACPLACGTCPADDGPAARLDRAHGHACQLGQLLGGGGGGAWLATGAAVMFTRPCVFH